MSRCGEWESDWTLLESYIKRAAAWRRSSFPIRHAVELLLRSGAVQITAKALPKRRILEPPADDARLRLLALGPLGLGCLAQPAALLLAIQHFVVSCYCLRSAECAAKFGSARGRDSDAAASALASRSKLSLADWSTPAQSTCSRLLGQAMPKSLVCRRLTPDGIFLHCIRAVCLYAPCSLGRQIALIDQRNNAIAHGSTDVCMLEYRAIR